MADQWHDESLVNALARDIDDDDVPDAWDEAPVEKPKKTDVEEKSKAPAKAPATSKNKQVKKKYLGDGHTSDDEFLESLKEPDRVYTAEELEDLRKRADLQKEEVKLKMATDFIGTSGEKDSLDNVNLVNKDEFLNYSFRLYNRLELLSKSEFYAEFLDDLLTGLAKPLSLESVKRMSARLQAIVVRKQNEKKNSATKKSVKPQLKADRRNELDSFVGDGIVSVDVDPGYDEDNDFM